MANFLRRLRYWLNPGRMDAELSEEMEFHRAMLAANGSPAAAMGNATLAREDARGVWIWPWLESLWRDLAYGLRSMRREPGFTLTALLALGSAIGVNSSLFTMFNAFALRPWAVRDPARVVTLHHFSRQGGRDFGIAEYRYLSQHAHTFTGLVAMRNGEQVKLDDRPLQLTYVSGNYFQTLGVEPELGRAFLDSEDRIADPQAVAVISHDLWQNRFAADPQIVGRTIRLDDVPFTVVGVAPVDFTGTNPLRNDLWTPLPARGLLRPNDRGVKPWLTLPGICCTPVAGRLAPGVTRAQAQAELDVLVEQFRTLNHIEAQHGDVVLAGTAWMAGPRKKSQAVAGITLLFVGVTLVLLLACANIGNLLLARAASRRREIGIRLSLGGSRSRLVRQLLIESMLLALMAAAAALPMAFFAASVILRRLAPETSFRVTPDLTLLAYTAAIAAASCLAFGLAPALHGTSNGISAALKNETGALRTRSPLRSILLSVQVAISVALLASAGVLVHGLQRAQAMDPGFDVHNVSVLSIDLPASQYAGPRTNALTDQLIDRLDGAPHMPACGIAQAAPLSGSIYMTDFQVLGPIDSRPLHIWVSSVSGGYFEALHIPVLDGRTFTPKDLGSGMMINRSAARRWWPNESPVGKSALANGKARQIVGVVADTYTHDLSTSAEAMLYLPVSGALGPPVVLVRDRAPASIEGITAIIKQIEPRAQVRAEPLTANFNRQMQPNIVGAALAGFLGLLALAIASVGVSGVFAYMVGQRTREIGIRIALGAKPLPIVWLVLASSLRALICGSAVGIAGAVGGSIVLAHVLPGLKPLDPAAYGGVVLVLSAAVALASAVPVQRAIHVDPVRALRWE